MGKPLSFEQKRDQSVRFLLGYAVSQNPAEIARAVSQEDLTESTLGARTHAVIREKMASAALLEDAHRFYPPFMILERAVDDMNAFLRPHIAELDEADMHEVISRSNLAQVMANIAIRDRDELALLVKRQRLEPSLRLDEAQRVIEPGELPSSSSRGCPYAQNELGEPVPQPLFVRFVDWNAKLVTDSILAARAEQSTPTDDSIELVGALV